MPESFSNYCATSPTLGWSAVSLDYHDDAKQRGPAVMAGGEGGGAVTGKQRLRWAMMEASDGGSQRWVETSGTKWRCSSQGRPDVSDGIEDSVS
jgi:hypothetical protein